ncbi:hypothetical protein GGQ61_002533 [Phenylobacterium haematophilum]|uniref:Uncharacterized protein n=1 Tax=Phenylobacterium haematophilum TaxID=98513 RepID=A0A839ZYY1_9CAUL|nr:hypothetical protein [Phenylobacterium haematophilum]MBB3891805.1 hypothetical protein [Phenylobacterium haematophilum]
MTTFSPVPADTRRAVVRIVATEMTKISRAMARVHGDDVIEYFVFTALWVLNSSHLIGDQRYVQLKSIPPDVLRKPASIEELRAALPMPADILQTYVKRLLEKGLAEEVSGKLVVPTAVFTQPEMLQGTSELYESVVQMVTSMRAAGFSFGD